MGFKLVFFAIFLALPQLVFAVELHPNTKGGFLFRLHSNQQFQVLKILDLLPGQMEHSDQVKIVTQLGIENLELHIVRILWATF